MDFSLLNGTRIISVDIETTDLPIKKAWIRELGAAEYVDGKFVRGSSALFSGGKCAKGAEAVHGISDEMVMGKPTFMEKASSFCAFVNGNGKPADLLGHNITKYDFPIIKKFLYKSGLDLAGNGPDGRARIIDTCVLARKHFQFPSNTLENLCAVFGIVHGGHRALGDATCTWELFLKIIEMTQCTDFDSYINVF